MDRLLIFSQILLGILGALGVSNYAPDKLSEQLIYVFVAFVIIAIISYIPPKTIAKISPYFYSFSILLLILVLIIGVSTPGQHAQRWIPIGPFTLQPSELAKVAVVAYLATFFHNHSDSQQGWALWRPMFIIGIASGLILVETDFSTAIFVFLLAILIMAIAGTNFLRLLGIALVAAVIAVFVLAPVLNKYDHVMNRLMVFFNADSDSDESYQPRMANRAIEHSGITGLGPGIPVRVPAAHTDMVSVSIWQAIGLSGILSLVVLYFVIAIRGMQIASLKPGPGSLLAAGAVTYISGQAILNLMVSAGLLPITGVVLPFVSHGFNNLLSVSIAMGFIQSNYRAARRQGLIK